MLHAALLLSSAQGAADWFSNNREIGMQPTLPQFSRPALRGRKLMGGCQVAVNAIGSGSVLTNPDQLVISADLTGPAIPRMGTVQPEEVIKFWFEENKDHWFVGGERMDGIIIERFKSTHDEAMKGEGLVSWRTSPTNRLAEIIVLDQFSRQIYRRQGQAFAGDERALALSKAMVESGDHLKLPSNDHRTFCYMPFMHAESPLAQDQGIELYAAAGLEFNLKFAKEHKEVIKKFGRFPTRNKALNRENTPEEEEYLKNAGGWGQ